ncbi:MAG TPA: hypothetical protein VF021_00630 [Longimicrobiales bacterium]
MRYHGSFACALVLLLHTPAHAQSGSELFLVPIRERAGTVVVSDSITRITNRIGYDNQPAFVPGTPFIYYTVIDSTSHADIWRYDRDARRTAPVTRTLPESEYSATPLPTRAGFSVVRVEADSTQRLWSFNPDGSDARLVLANVKPVGYHAWLDENHVVVFVLGNPATLQLVDVRIGAAQTLASDIGRALQRVPDRNAFSFVQHNADSTSSIVLYDVATGTKRSLLPTLPQNEYHVWLKDGTLISANGSVLYQWRPGDRGWTYLADLGSKGLNDISRLAVSPDERVLAVVAADPPVQTGQNPSPMVEHSRAHVRIPRGVVPGIRDSVAGPLGKYVPLFIPAGVKHADRLNLVIHFHGSAPLVSEYAAAQIGHDHVIATVQLGSGSGIYDRSFSDPAVFDSLLARLRQAAARDLKHDVAFRSIVLSGWSAGYGAVRAVLRDSAHAELVNGALLLDGLHTGYIPDRKVVAEGGQIDTTNFAPFLRYARWAMSGRKRFLITHSEIFPGTFASTTESSNYMIEALGLKRLPVLKWGPLGMQQTSEARSGGFEVRGYAGNAGPDHVDHLHGLGEFVKAVERL